MRTEATSKTSGQKRGSRGKEFSPLCIKVGVSSGKGEIPLSRERSDGRGGERAASTIFFFLFSSPWMGEDKR